MGRSVIIYVMGTFIILSVALLNATRNVSTAGTQAISYLNDAIARNITNSMTDVLLARLADSSSLRIETPVTQAFMGGSVTYSITSINSIGNASNDNHEGDDHGNGDDNGDHGNGDHHGNSEDHSSLFDFSKIHTSYLAGSMLYAFLAPDEHSESEDHGSDHGDDHEGDDHDGDESANGSDTVKILVLGTYGNSTKSLATYVAMNLPTTTTPNAIQAGVTSRQAVSTLGNLQIDGRNHDLNGTLVAGTGTYGIWSAAAIRQGGSSDIGGTYNNTDYAPSKPANRHVVSASATYPSGSFPDTPDKVFGGASGGFSEGTLKNLAESGTEGSQYVQDPSELEYPLTGITYVELANGSTWQPNSIEGSGVLIVHNTAGNAIVKNLNGGTFKGIIIADDFIHLKATVLVYCHRNSFTIK